MLELPIRRDDCAYRDTWLWVPKSKVNIRMLRHSLTLSINGGQDTLVMYREAEHHIGIPRERLDLEDLKYEVVDLTPQSYEEVKVESKIVLDAQDPSDTIQRDSFVDLLDSTNGILNLRCGAGKTVILLHFIAELGVPALIINDRAHILKQWEKEIKTHLEVDGKVGWLQGKPSKWKWETNPIALASLKTLALYHDEVPADLCRRFGVVIWDECLVRGTLVGGCPIEDIGVGDWVQAHDQQRHQSVAGQVIGAAQHPPESLVTVYVADDQVTCTPNHPFLTPLGWVPAGELTSTDMVLCYNHEQEDLQMRETNGRKGNREVLRRLPTRTQGGTAEKDQLSVRLVQGPDCDSRTETVGAVPQEWASLLLQGVPRSGGVRRALKENAGYESTACPTPGSTDAREQSNEEPQSTRTTTSYTTRNGLETASSRRQRKTVTSSPAAPSQRSRMGYGSSGQDLRQARLRAVDTLQNRHSGYRTEDRHRGGRSITQRPKSPSTRPEEGRIPTWVRVDRVKIHEPTSDGTFGGRCPGGLVYNLTIEETPTFTVGKSEIVVHNCHHLAAHQYSQTADMFPGRRYGATATVNRPDGLEMQYLWHVGPVVHKNLKHDLVPEVTFVASPTTIDWECEEQRAEYTDKFGTLHIQKLCAFVGQRPEELTFAQSIIDREVAAGGDILALSVSKDHGRELHSRYPGSGIIDADVHFNKRLAVLADHKLTFATVQIAREALDKKALDVLILLTEFSSDNNLQQAIGRVLRKCVGKAPKVIILSHEEIAPMRFMGEKLRRHFRKWGMEVKNG